MAGKIFFGMLPKQGSFSLFSGLSLWGRLNHFSYCTAKKTGQLKESSAAMSVAECKKHNQSIPTYDQFKKDPERQKEFAKVFEDYAKDPVYQKEEAEAASLGYRLFKEG